MRFTILLINTFSPLIDNKVKPSFMFESISSFIDGFLLFCRLLVTLIGKHNEFSSFIDDLMLVHDILLCKIRL